MLSTLAYTSSMLIPVHSTEMLAIARAALRNNPRLGVTGALYFDGHHFFQVLEGEDTALACLFDTIRADPRHMNVRLVHRGPITERRFENWSMKFVDGTGRRDLSRLFEVAGDAAPVVQADEARIEALLAA